jgi:hypothetical protein
MIFHSRVDSMRSLDRENIMPGCTVMFSSLSASESSNCEVQCVFFSSSRMRATMSQAFLAMGERFLRKEASNEHGEF